MLGLSAVICRDACGAMLSPAHSRSFCCRLHQGRTAQGGGAGHSRVCLQACQWWRHFETILRHILHVAAMQQGGPFRSLLRCAMACMQLGRTIWCSVWRTIARPHNRPAGWEVVSTQQLRSHRSTQAALWPSRERYRERASLLVSMLGVTSTCDRAKESARSGIHRAS